MWEPLSPPVWSRARAACPMVRISLPSPGCLNLGPRRHIQPAAVQKLKLFRIYNSGAIHSLGHVFCHGRLRSTTAQLTKSIQQTKPETGKTQTHTNSNNISTSLSGYIIAMFRRCVEVL